MWHMQDAAVLGGAHVHSGRVVAELHVPMFREVVHVTTSQCSCHSITCTQPINAACGCIPEECWASDLDMWVYCLAGHVPAVTVLLMLVAVQAVCTSSQAVQTALGGTLHSSWHRQERQCWCMAGGGVRVVLLEAQGGWEYRQIQR
jgi:hypothetical protein